jgi:uncharacterized protein (DUF1697 family)
VSRFVAFLGGINLGKRQIRMAELKDGLEAAGFKGVKTLLASGNVLLDAPDEAGLKASLEAAMTSQFGFRIEVVLRSDAELRAMIASTPFKAFPDDADVKRYVMMFDQKLEPRPALTSVPGDYDFVRIDARDIYVVAYPKGDGRYGEGLDKLGKQLDKGLLVTTRNWNTIIKAAA